LVVLQILKLFNMKYELYELPYELNSLEPYISERTLELHHNKHNKAYITSLNAEIGDTKYKNLDLDTIVKVADGPVFNYAAQVWNHKFYFEGLKPESHNALKGPLADLIKRNFGSVTFFKNSFIKASLSLFGAGWAWLVLNPEGTIEIILKSNAGNPLRIGLFPLMNCDLWEHAYYLDYQNRKKDYLEAFWKLINWEIIEKRYNEFSKTEASVLNS
jgi:Fe-Mn family superoxide dismutase